MNPDCFSRFTHHVSRRGIGLKLYYLILVFLFFIPVFYILSETDEEKLQKLRQKKAETIRKKRKVEQSKKSVIEKEKGILKELQKLEVEVQNKERRLKQLERQLVHWNRQIKKLQLRLDKLRGDFSEYRTLAAERIRAMYKFSYNGTKINSLKFLFGASDLSEFLNRYKYINSITQADQKMLTDLQLQMNKIENTESMLRERVSSIEEAKREIQQEKISILRNKQIRERLLEKYRTEKETYNKTLAELEAAVAKFEELLGEVGNESIQINDYENFDGITEEQVGKLLLPTQGKIISNQSPSESGITIKALKGSKIKSVADGVVARVKESIVGYGNTVLIDHGNGYISVYAHASEILVKKGQGVRKGQVIAKVGESGSLIGPILYFELWKGVKRLNTKRWIAK